MQCYKQYRGGLNTKLSIRISDAKRVWINLFPTSGVINEVSFHDARHTHASLMLKQGVHPKMVQEWLGHATISVTLNTYSHVAPELQEAVAAGFDKMVLPRRETEAVEKSLLANY